VLLAAGTERGLAVRRIKRAAADFAIADGRLGYSHNDPRKQTLLSVEGDHISEEQVDDSSADPNRALKAGALIHSDTYAELKRAAMSSGYNFLVWSGGVFVGAGLGADDPSDKGALLGYGVVTTAAVFGVGAAGTLVDNLMLTRGYMMSMPM
jgi:hypothetical protein